MSAVLIIGTIASATMIPGTMIFTDLHGRGHGDGDIPGMDGIHGTAGTLTARTGTTVTTVGMIPGTAIRATAGIPTTGILRTHNVVLSGDI